MPLLILRSAVFPDGSLRFSPGDLPVSIGRSHRADIVVEDRLMSRVHAEFRWNIPANSHRATSSAQDQLNP